MKTTVLSLSRIDVISRLLAFLNSGQYQNTTINFTNGIITTELKISFLKKDKISFELKSSTESETHVEISANRQNGDKVITDALQEDELLNKIKTLTNTERK